MTVCSLGDRGNLIPRTSWLVSLSEMMIFQFSWKPFDEAVRWRVVDENSVFSSGLCIHIGMHL